MENYVNKEFSYLEILKDLKDQKIITTLTNSDKESEMEKALSLAFSHLINLQSISLEQLQLHHKQDKKIIDIKCKSVLTSSLLNSYKKNFKKI